ncbi:DUF423 domain containing protein-like protein [Dinothrombium tinctorium]|uniref:DUF423 domain containing protein-like protein n=1 Tax=Dinothrombium tinctorium TaxID=1965070 RepID=A0A3S3P3B5_9ACAR|nr:DUF423 domain containing protein-like protein [Dinothrombium tinctorium]RWS11471.1 DUF423 domain containing protein-like protein [Dinothrombium tinctorium]
MDYVTLVYKNVTDNGAAIIRRFYSFTPKEKVVETTTVKTPLLQKCAHKGLRSLLGREAYWVAAAGVFGALGVAMGAYGEHGLSKHFVNGLKQFTMLGLPPDFPAQRKKVFDVANKYQMFHSLAMLAVPLARRPHIVGSLLASGMIIFCGTCYIHALTGNEQIIRFTPIGGWTLILAWISFVF